ncbi:SDR family oxidoreductase [Candidatus Woesearchaeota archaeon]|nr:SDR family oxidoreductase [Candidatus Woesearchaeota archaeon]
MRYLVTGGTGFIGSNIVLELVRRGEEVRVLDNNSTGDPRNVDAVKGRIELIRGDIRDLLTVREAVKDVDFVLHQAALCSVPRSVDDPIASNEHNVSGTMNVLVAARDAGVKRVVYAASSSAYGDTPTLPKEEDMPAAPTSPYGVSKLVGEYYCKVFHAVYGLETVSLRYFNVFGPHQTPDSPYAAVIPLFMKAALLGKRPVVFGDGEQTRDFTFVTNNVNANILACTAKKAAGETINIATGETISLNRLLERIADLTGTRIEAEYKDERAGDIKHSLASIEKAKRLLGYEVEVGFDEGLERSYGWYKENLSG